MAFLLSTDSLLAQDRQTDYYQRVILAVHMEGLVVGESLVLIGRKYDEIGLFGGRRRILESQQRPYFADLRDHLC